MGTFSGVEQAHAFLSPSVAEENGIDAKAFRKILEGSGYEGLIGCSDWKVLDTSQPSEDVAVLTLRVLLKPIPGCVRTSGVAEQGGITWPAFYRWQLARQPADAPAHAGCWMLENATPQAPPVDVAGTDGTPLLEKP